MRLPFDFSSLEEANDQLNRQTFNERSFVTPLRGQTFQGAYLKANTTTFESWYVPGLTNSTALSTSSPAVDILWAVPFVAESPYLLDGLAFNVTTVSGANGKARVGIYSAAMSGSGLFYPGSLLVDGGGYDVASATGAKSTTSLATSLTLGALYFVVYQCGVAAPTIRVAPVAALSPSLGFSDTLPSTPQVGYQVASTYSTVTGLPSTYPTGATAVTTVMPAIFQRYSGVASSTRYYPVYSPFKDGFKFSRSRILSSLGTEISTSSDSYFTIESAIRAGASTSILDTFDSRSNVIQPGLPYFLTDGDFSILADEIVEVIVSQYGKPIQDLSDIVVQTDLLFGGS